MDYDSYEIENMTTAATLVAMLIRRLGGNVVFTENDLLAIEHYDPHIYFHSDGTLECKLQLDKTTN